LKVTYPTNETVRRFLHQKCPSDTLEGGCGGMDVSRSWWNIVLESRCRYLKSRPTSRPTESVAGALPFVYHPYVLLQARSCTSARGGWDCDWSFATQNDDRFVNLEIVNGWTVSAQFNRPGRRSPPRYKYTFFTNHYKSRTSSDRK
jgi:hypothetical protein